MHSLKNCRVHLYRQSPPVRSRQLSSVRVTTPTNRRVSNGQNGSFFRSPINRHFSSSQATRTPRFEHASLKVIATSARQKNILFVQSLTASCRKNISSISRDRWFSLDTTSSFSARNTHTLSITRASYHGAQALRGIHFLGFMSRADQLNYAHTTLLRPHGHPQQNQTTHRFFARKNDETTSKKKESPESKAKKENTKKESPESKAKKGNTKKESPESKAKKENTKKESPESKVKKESAIKKETTTKNDEKTKIDKKETNKANTKPKTHTKSNMAKNPTLTATSSTKPQRPNFDPDDDDLLMAPPLNADTVNPEFLQAAQESEEIFQVIFSNQEKKEKEKVAKMSEFERQEYESSKKEDLTWDKVSEIDRVMKEEVEATPDMETSTEGDQESFGEFLLQQKRQQEIEAEKPIEISQVVDILKEYSIEDIVVINLEQKMSFAKAMIICTGKSKRHIEAVMWVLKKEFKGAFSKNAGSGISSNTFADSSGDSDTPWLALDANHLLIHLFTQEGRVWYDLEHLWCLRYGLSGNAGAEEEAEDLDIYEPGEYEEFMK